jgi:hypothetical protein
MTPEQLQGLGLLSRKTETQKAAELRFTRRIRSRSGTERQWPSYEESLSRAGPKHSGPGPDRSNADFWWCYYALRDGFSKEETEARLLEVSECVRERVRGSDKRYPRLTVDNAAERLAYNRQKSRA